MENPWPAGVPMSLWTYSDLRPDALAQVPMMGIKFAPGFLYAFFFGCLFIAIFSWKRFLVKSDVSSVSRALSDLSPGDIGGRGALLRAYFIYCGAILILYVSLTFFGRLILQSTQIIPVAGIQTGVDELQFDSAQWPLMLAFAFAGLAELLPPVKLTEGWLRNRAYRAVGIPVRLEQTMRNLIVALDAAAAGNDPQNDPLTRRLLIYRDRWVATFAGHPWTQGPTMQRISRSDDLISLLAQLELLVSWARSARGKWPGREVSNRVHAMERDYIDDAARLLDSLHRRLSEDPGSDTGEALANRQSRFFADLVAAAARAEALRFDLVGILAIFIERDPDSPVQDAEINGKGSERPGTVRIDPALHRLLVAADPPDSAGIGPEAGLFLALIAVFLLYAAAAWRGVLEPIGTFVETSNVYGVLATAAVETLRVAALTWLPLLAAFSLRQHLWDNGDWAGAARTERRSGYAMQIFACLCLGIAVSIIGLMGVGALKAFFIAPTPGYFFSLYVGSYPFILYFPSQAVILVVLIPMALLSADLRKSSAMRLWYGVGCAAGVVYLSVQHQLYWNPQFGAHCPGLTILSSSDCSGRGELVMHLTLGILAFLAAGVLGELPERTRQVRQRWLPDEAIPLLAIAAMALWPADAAQAQAGCGVTAHEPQRIVVAMRSDAPPFSYLLPDSDPSQPGSWHGYLARLCLDIFAGQTAFEVTLLPVKATDRFSGLNLPPTHKDHTDMLCDAVTMRFSDPARSERAVFSPIVFASGVSYLDKIERNMSNGMLIGYIAGTTASEVAFKACEVDHFNALLPKQRDFLFQRCMLRSSAAGVRSALEDAYASQSTADADEAARARAHAAKQLATLLAAARDLDNISKDRRQALQLDPDSRRLMKAVLGQPEQPVAEETKNNSSVMNCHGELDKTANTTVPKICEDALQLVSDASCNGPQPQDETLSDRPIAERPWPDYRFCPLRSHEDLIEWFCGGPSTQRRIYMGDRELILDQLKVWNETRGRCATEQPDGAEFLSYEPYAFPISVFRPRLIQFVQKRIHQLFSDRAQMNARFASSFPGKRMSPTLAYLFLLNAVEDEATLRPEAKPQTAPD